MLDLRSITNTAVCHSPRGTNKIPSSGKSRLSGHFLWQENAFPVPGEDVTPTDGLHNRALLLILPALLTACRRAVAHTRADRRLDLDVAATLARSRSNFWQATLPARQQQSSSQRYRLLGVRSRPSAFVCLRVEEQRLCRHFGHNMGCPNHQSTMGARSAQVLRR